MRFRTVGRGAGSAGALIVGAGVACGSAGARGTSYPEIRFIAPPSLPPSFPPRAFHLASNWQGNAIPGGQQGAVFDGAGVTPIPWWVVSFSQFEFTTQLKVRGCTAQFKLEGNQYNVTNTFGDGLIVGSPTVTAQTTFDLLASPSPATLSSGLQTIVGGAGNCAVNVFANNTLDVGGLNFTRGDIKVKSGGTLNGGVDVILFGFPILLNINVGGSLGSPLATLTCDAGGKVKSSTSLTVGGSGVFLANGVVQVDRVLSIGQGGAVTIGGPLSIAAGGNTMTGARASEEIALTDAGSLSAASYSQTYGVLSVHQFAGSASPVVGVSGAATLGATFRVASLAPSFNPTVGQRFPLMTPASLTGQFDLAVFPGFGDQRFLRLEYVTSPSPRVEIVTDSSTHDITYAPPQTVAVAGEPRAAALGDLTGDVFPELILTVPGASPSAPGSLIILTNGGNTAHGAWLGFSGSTQITIGRDPRSVVVADVDADLDNDILVVETGENGVRLLRDSGGSPGQVPPLTQSLYTMGAEPVDLAVADFTGDGLPDFVTADGSSHTPTVTFRVNAGAGMFGDASSQPAGEPGGRPNSIGSGDLDNDKDVDVVVGLADASGAGATISVLPNTSQADGLSFGPPLTFRTRAPSRALAVRDLNADGKPEVVSAEGDARMGFITALRNTSGAEISFASAAPIEVGVNALAVVLTDSDSDGDTDVAALTTSTGGANEVVVFRNDSSGVGGTLVLTEDQTIGAGEDPSVVAAGDVDNDGRQDIVTSDTTGADGGPSDSVASRLNDQADPAPGDVNGDGRVDFLDLNALLSVYGSSAGQGAYLPAADFNHNGFIDFIDLNTLLGEYGSGADAQP